MRAILEALRDGDHSIVDRVAEADKYWSEVLAKVDQLSVQELAASLQGDQMRFEQIAGERYLGKIFCGWLGFTHLYSCQNGFDENMPRAQKLRDAIAASFCSVEVKHAARDAVELYGVDD